MESIKIKIKTGFNGTPTPSPMHTYDFCCHVVGEPNLQCDERFTTLANWRVRGEPM
jgi:hypothetical protein